MSLSVLLAIAIAVGLFFWLRQRQGGKSLRSRRPSPGGTLFAPVHGQTRRLLLRLVGGNRATAERLVTQVRQRYPGQTEQWYWEKAIHDIQRDRRS